MRALALIPAALVLGCGGAERSIEPASRQAEAVRGADESAVPRPEHLTLAAMTITAGDDAVHLAADGTITAPGKQGALALLRRTGELLHPGGGQLLILNHDGTITSNDDQLAPLSALVIGPTGEVARGEETVLSVGPEGAVIRGEAEVARLEGPAEGRRAAMLVLLMVTTGRAADPPAPAVEPEQTTPPGEDAEDAESGQE